MKNDQATSHIVGIYYLKGFDELLFFGAPTDLKDELESLHIPTYFVWRFGESLLAVSGLKEQELPKLNSVSFFIRHDPNRGPFIREKINRCPYCRDQAIHQSDRFCHGCYRYFGQ